MEVAVRNFEDREAPDAPSIVALSRRSTKVVVRQGHRPEPNDHEPWGNGVIPQEQGFGLGRKLGVDSDVDDGGRHSAGVVSADEPFDVVEVEHSDRASSGVQHVVVGDSVSAGCRQDHRVHGHQRTSMPSVAGGRLGVRSARARRPGPEVRAGDGRVDSRETGGVEREVLFTGMGGQGVQLAARVLAEAAVAEGRDAMIFGSYGGMMRGGRTDSSLVIADGPVNAPPIVPAAWAAFVMHDEFAEPTWAKLRRNGVAFVNSTVVDDVPHAGSVVAIPAGDIAIDLGGVQCQSLVMLGALVASTAIVALDSVQAAATAALPPYRRQHVELNERALAAGYEAVASLTHAAWAP